MKNLTEDQVAEFIKTAYQILTGYDKYKMMDFILDSPYRIEQNSGNTVLCKPASAGADGAAVASGAVGKGVCVDKGRKKDGPCKYPIGTCEWCANIY